MGGQLIVRRISGGLVLLWALVAALVVPRVLNPVQVDGAAVIAPPPPPPTVGECVDQTYAGASTTADGRVQMDRAAVVVPCDEPHGSEIVQVGPALTPSDAQFGPAGDVLLSCSTDLWALDGWSAMSTVTTGLIGPDARQAAAGQQWTACTAGVSEGRLSRSLRTLSAGGSVPAVFGRCSTQSDRVPDSFGLTTCTDPHTHEDIGYRDLGPGSTLTQAELASGCTELAVRATGRVGLPSDPDLAVKTDAYAWFASGEGSFVALPFPTDAVAGRVTCAIHTSGGQLLTASLRQFGDGPLPLTR